MARLLKSNDTKRIGEEKLKQGEKKCEESANRIKKHGQGQVYSSFYFVLFYIFKFYGFYRQVQNRRRPRRGSQQQNSQRIRIHTRKPGSGTVPGRHSQVPVPVLMVNPAEYPFRTKGATGRPRQSYPPTSGTRINRSPSSAPATLD